MKEKILFLGAEAVITKTKFLGLDSIKKVRQPKKYKAEELDLLVRNRRFIQELRMNSRLKSLGIRTPIIYFADKKKNEIIMEEIKGMKLTQTKNKKCFRKLGEAIALMHENDLIHGDLTLNNVLECKGELCIIDLGLGFESMKTEEKACDLLNLKKELTAMNKKKEFKGVLKGYEKYSKWRETIAQINAIEKRARYMNH